MDEPKTKKRGPKNPLVVRFIEKLFKMVNECRKGKVVTYDMTQKCILIYDTDKFYNEIMPKFFGVMRQDSFVRQMNSYGFHKKMYDGVVGYSNSLFDPDNPNSLMLIKKKKKMYSRKEEKEKLKKLYETRHAFSLSISSEVSDELSTSKEMNELCLKDETIEKTEKSDKSDIIDERYILPDTNNKRGCNGFNFVITDMEALNDKQVELQNEQIDERRLSQDQPVTQKQEKYEKWNEETVRQNVVELMRQTDTEPTLRDLQMSLQNLQNDFSILSDNQRVLSDQLRLLTNSLVPFLSSGFEESNYPLFPATDQDQMNRHQV
ncbi:heat shock transcription factor, putative [Entamoeba invadens IP1]|uniref:Heat shock transcription factor, putative n=1 Tax=Entamoeba invadens IP1 TaxID=370355 RepID=A0A0A1UDZ1_ENTIV|nr:heat shock transcription factor, putative [Entamoeba invadens IP1]ELP94810.1 heat shock transcription factor, putative [Entamoeba invadens IP1]|eukprot:XP_004261581.1 heat shock transcription factor, putative [Entamoeba invadens IP1]